MEMSYACDHFERSETRKSREDHFELGAASREYPARATEEKVMQLVSKKKPSRSWDSIVKPAQSLLHACSALQSKDLNPE